MRAEKNMRGKQWEDTPKSKSTHFNKLTPRISNCFKKRISSINTTYHFFDRRFTDRRHLPIKTTTVHHFESLQTCNLPWIVATVDGADDEEMLLNPLTLKPHHCNLPQSFNLRKVNCYKYALHSFHHTIFKIDKIVIPLSREKVLSDNTMFALLGGGKLIGRRFWVEGEQSIPLWVRLSDKRFDDIILCGPKDKKIFVVDRFGKLYLLCNNVTSRVLRFNTAINCLPLEGVSGRVGWRKRLVEGANGLYLVIRVEDKFFRVYMLQREYKSTVCWNEVTSFSEGNVLFVSKDCCFFAREFGRKEYEDCIVFSESGFPKCGYDGWEYNGEDEIRVFRISDGRYGRVGESAEFPEIDWSPPSWVFDEGSRLSVHSHSQTEGEPDEVDEGEQSDSKNLNSEDEEEQEVMELDSDSQDQDQEEGSDSDIQDPEGGKLQCDSNSHEMEDEEMHTNANIDGDASLQEDVRPSIFASISAAEEEVTQTLLRINGGNEANGKDTSRTNITPSALRPCTSSKIKSCQNDSATAKFEGFDVRSDVVPTLQKIWRNHGNIIENSTIRNCDIIARALESLATVVQSLENEPIQSLTDDQVNYLSTALSDLKIMSFKVHWLSSAIEKAVKVHESKALVDSLNKLGQLSTKVQERKDILLDEFAKLTEEENKLKIEMAKVSKLIPFLGQVKFDEPHGSGLT